MSRIGLMGDKPNGPNMPNAPKLRHPRRIWPIRLIGPISLFRPIWPHQVHPPISLIALISEEFGFLAHNLVKQHVGQSAGAEAQPLVGEPFFAQDLFYYRVVD